MGEDEKEKEIEVLACCSQLPWAIIDTERTETVFWLSIAQFSFSLCVCSQRKPQKKRRHHNGLDRKEREKERKKANEIKKERKKRM